MLARLFHEPLLTPARVRAAYAVGIATDAVQFVLGPIGWAGVDEALDVAAAALTWWLLGFHPLLLPTFVVEFIPFADMLPTWTGCIAAVVALRRNRHRVEGPPAGGTVIDV